MPTAICHPRSFRHLPSIKPFLPCLVFCLSVAWGLAQEAPLPEQSFTVEPGKSPDPGAEETLARFNALASGIGWEFSPNAETTGGLKSLGMKFIRCINVEGIKGTFDETGAFHLSEPLNRMDQHLKTCQTIGATPMSFLPWRCPPSSECLRRMSRNEWRFWGRLPATAPTGMAIGKSGTLTGKRSSDT